MFASGLWCGVATIVLTSVVVVLFGFGRVMSVMRSMILFNFVSCAPIARCCSAMAVFMVVMAVVIAASWLCMFVSVFLFAITMLARPVFRVPVRVSSVSCCGVGLVWPAPDGAVLVFVVERVFIWFVVALFWCSFWGTCMLAFCS